MEQFISKVYAAGVPTVSIAPPGTGFKSIGGVVTVVVNWSVILATVFALIWIIFGGFSWITAGDDAKKMGAAQGKITSGIVGLAIVASAYGIFRIIIGIIPGLNKVFT